MAKITALFFTALFSCYMLAHATRPEQGFHKKSSGKTQHVGVEAEHVEAAVDNCEGVSEDECFMRRPLVAHLDYTYTQKHEP